MIPKSALRTVREFAHLHDLLRPGPLVVAVSGGTDSTALLLILAALRDEFGLLLHVAHFDHRARPRAAAKDAAYVAALAGRCGATLRVGKAETAPKSEDDARRARYAFLRGVATAYGATAVATGHTRDDQAETVLLHLARGSGLAGLAAMRPSREGLVRPLLALGRPDTAAVCAAGGLTPREDPSNRSLAFARNRVRRRVLPELARLNPRVAEALARLAEAAARDEDALENAARDLLTAARDGDAIDLDRLGSGTLAERALAQAWLETTGTTLTSRHRAALAGEAARRAGTASLDLPGGRVVREYRRLMVQRAAASRQRNGAGAAPRLQEPALFVRDIPLDWGGWQLLLTTTTARPEGHTFVGAVPVGSAVGLVVRARRNGDRIAGGRKVQDLLTDAKVPVRLRGAVPLVVDAVGRVRWVPGLAGARPPEDGDVGIYARPPLELALPGIIRGRAALHGLALRAAAVLAPLPARGAEHEPR